jgi:anti-sigma factor RsiW
VSRMSDAILMSYVDGELGLREQAAVEAEIAVDGELAMRADRHRRLRALIEAAFDEQSGTPLADTPLVLPIASRRRKSWWRRLWPFSR